MKTEKELLLIGYRMEIESLIKTFKYGLNGFLEAEFDHELKDIEDFVLKVQRQYDEIKALVENKAKAEAVNQPTEARSGE